MLRVIQLNTLEDRSVHDKNHWDGAVRSVLPYPAYFCTYRHPIHYYLAVLIFYSSDFWRSPCRRKSQRTKRTCEKSSVQDGKAYFFFFFLWVIDTGLRFVSIFVVYMGFRYHVRFVSILSGSENPTSKWNSVTWVAIEQRALDRYWSHTYTYLHTQLQYIFKYCTVQYYCNKDYFTWVLDTGWDWSVSLTALKTPY